MTGPVGVIVRDARPDEAPLLEVLQRRSAAVWEEDRAILEAHPDAIAVDPAALADGHGRVAASPQDDRPLAFAVRSRVTVGESELDALFVEPSLLRSGLGRLLVDDAAARAAAAGARELFVVSGPGALAFYERCGFTRVGEVPTRFGPAAQLVRRL